MTTATRTWRIGAKQAARMLQLSAGYVVARKDAYTDLIAKGLVEEAPTYLVGDVEYERKNGAVYPALTWDGRQALLNYVNQHGRLEVEIRQVLADYTTVIRMDPKDANERR